MNIGDQVRVLHGSEEGFITKIIDDKTIEIEIEDGFTMPVLMKDVVLVKKEETDFFDREKTTPVEPKAIKKSISHLGIYLAFIPSSENFVDLHIVNNTDYQLLLAAHHILKDDVKGLFSKIINPKTFICENKWNIKDFENWQDLHIDILYFKSQTAPYLAPISKRLKFQAKSFFNSFKNTPLIDKKGYLYHIDQNVQTTNSIVFSSNEEIGLKNVEAPESIIDLHIESLEEISDMPPKDIFNYQIDVFQQKLDSAIAFGLSEITFIHGNGNGSLKSYIQKQLSKHLNVAYYQDAQKNKFGYGATYVKLK